ncbi:hypothetical protein V8C34DRAFT_267510 [Trichoderma compactum]
MGAVVSCVSIFHPSMYPDKASPTINKPPSNSIAKQFEAIFRTIGSVIMAIISGIGNMLTAVINGVVSLFGIIISCITCGHSGRSHRYRHRGVRGSRMRSTV